MEKMISVHDILCKYEQKLFRYEKGADPVCITFITKTNALYNIVITDKENELRIIKLLNYLYNSLWFDKGMEVLWKLHF